MWFKRRDTTSAEESKAALVDARKNLREVKKRGREVSEYAEAFRELREKNHFADQLEELIIRRRRRAT